MIMRVISLLLFVISFLFAQSNEDCLDCHSDQEMAKSVNDTLELSLFVDDSVYQESAHGGMDCIECHSTINDVDHPEDLPNVVCADCHEDSQKAYEQSVHSITHEHSITILTGCKDCHGTHNIRSNTDSTSSVYVLNIETTCGKCHLKPEVIATLGLKGDGPAKAYHNSIHDRILWESPEKGAPTCINCHGYHEVFMMSDPRSTFNKLNRAETCGTCHAQEKEKYYQSIHWQAVKHGHYESPTCNDCHGEHQIESPQNVKSTTNRLNSSSMICANCHSSNAMMSRFGLDAERIQTYNRTYHGLALLKGSEEAANCTSCHEVHAIRSARDSSASIHPSNLEKTCGKCHENINSEFISIAAHPKDMESRNPVAFYAREIYIWMIVVVVGGMFIHNLIILLFYVRKKRRQLREERTIQRFQPFEVYQHAFLILSFFTLVITGFALKFPDALWVEGLVEIGMTEAIRSVLHRIAAVVMIVGSFIQMAYFIFNRHGRKDIAALMPRMDDVTGFWQNIRFYLGKDKRRPRFGRWDYTEKAEYLALIWGTAVMVVTGLILWFPEIFMGFLPSWIFEVSEIIHYFEAWLATLSIIIWHWFLVIYHPEKYPMSLTWMNGRVTEEELKHHHPKEYDELRTDTNKTNAYNSGD